MNCTIGYNHIGQPANSIADRTTSSLHFIGSLIANIFRNFALKILQFSIKYYSARRILKCRCGVSFVICRIAPYKNKFCNYMKHIKFSK